jgi:hypothetical protein
VVHITNTYSNRKLNTMSSAQLKDLVKATDRLIDKSNRKAHVRKFRDYEDYKQY